MPYKLENLELDEISIVDDPASPGAQVVLAKRGGETQAARKGSGMTDEQKKRMKELMDKGMSEADAKAQMQKEYDDMKKRDDEIAALKSNVDLLTKAAKEAGIEVVEKDGALTIEKRSDDDFVEIDGERVAKSAIPAPVLARIEKQQKDLDELKKAQDVQRLDKRAAEEIPNFGGTAETRRSLLKAVEGIADEQTRKSVEGVLKAASKLMEKGFNEAGHTGNDEAAEGSAMAELNKMAREYAEAKGVTFEAAFSEVTKSGKGAQLFAKRNEQ